LDHRDASSHNDKSDLSENPLDIARKKKFGGVVFG